MDLRAFVIYVLFLHKSINFVDHTTGIEQGFVVVDDVVVVVLVDFEFFFWYMRLTDCFVG